MAFLGQSDSSNQAPNYIGIPVQTAVNTLPIPIVWGENIVAPNLVWYGDFAKNDSGGGGGKGGGKNQQTDYSASFVMALCEGPIAAVTGVFVNDSTGGETLADANMTLISGAMPQSPWSYLSASHADQALGYQGTALVVAENYNFGSTPTLPDHRMSVKGRLQGTATWSVGAFAAADLALVIQDFLTSPQYGVPNWPASAIDTATLLSSGAATTTGDAALQTYLRALGLGFSPALVSQESGSSILTRWLQLANCAAVWSGTALKFIPYGDLPVTANGVTYQPDLTPLYSLNDEDFILDKDAKEDPVTVSRKAPEDCFTVVRVEVTDNDGNWSYIPSEARDNAAIEAAGGIPRIMNTVTAHEIVGTYHGGVSAQLILQRQLYVRNQYSFRLDWTMCGIEPMDLVEITDTALGLVDEVVRVTSVEEDEDGYLTVAAEEFPQGIATAVAYPRQGGTGTGPDTGAAPGPVNEPVIFEPGPELVSDGEIWIAASGAGAHWGGCQVWMSADGTDYEYLGDIRHKAHQGLTTAGLPAPSSEIDTTSTLSVDLSESNTGLDSFTDQDAELGRSLCWVDGELIAYANATLTGPNQYNLTYLARGLYGTVLAHHPAGRLFARLGAKPIFRHPLPAELVGVTLYFKLASFNLHGRNVEDLSIVSAWIYTPGGIAIPLGPVSTALANGHDMGWGRANVPPARFDGFGKVLVAPVAQIDLGPVAPVTATPDVGPLPVTTDSGQTVQIRGAGNSFLSGYAGARRELLADTTEWTVRVNDGAVNGGHPITPQPRTPAAMTGGPFTVADALRPYLILADPSGGAVSVTLSSSPSTGQMVWVKDVTGAAGTNAITISGGTIDGSASLVINSNYGEALLVASIYGWSIIR